MVLDCRVASQDHFIKGSMTIWIGTLQSKLPTITSGGHKDYGIGNITFLAHCLTLQGELIKVSCDFMGRSPLT